MEVTITAEPELLADIREVYSQRTTLETVLGDERPDIEDPLGLLTATVDVSVFESKDDLFYRVAFPETLLRTDRFITLLSYARSDRPYRSSSLGILADWEMPDNPQNNKRLLSLHESIPYWSEFMEHRQRFMMALGDEDTERAASFLDKQEKAFITKEEAIERLRAMVSHKAHARQYPLTENGLIRAWYKITTGKRMSKNKLKRFTQYPRSRLAQYQRSQFMSEILEFPDLLLTSVLERGILPQYKAVVDTNNPDALFYKGTLSDGHRVYPVEPLGNGRFRISYGNLEVTIGLGEDGFRRVDGNTEIERTALSPLIAWSRSKDAGERHYLGSEVPQQLSSGIDAQDDTLVGLIATTYLSPEQREMLPQRLSIKGGNYQQRMMEAQIPLLVLMYQDKIMSGSPLFSRVEAYAKS